MRQIALINIFFLISQCFGCYSFSGISIPQEASTFYVVNFEDKTSGASLAPPSIFIDFTERLKDKVRRETPLKYNESAQDLLFEGSISRYDISFSSPTAGSQINQIGAKTRLTIGVTVKYTNKMNEKQNWTQTFSHFVDIREDEVVADRQDELINIIFVDILEQIMKKAFGAW